MIPDRATRIFLGLVVFSLLGSFFSKAMRLDPGPIAPVTSLLTLGTGLVAAFQPYFATTSSPWRRLVPVFVLGAGAELLGLGTGFPFGRYAYMTHWWPTIPLSSLGPFPLALPFAWLLMAGSATFVASAMLDPMVWPWWRPAFLGGLIAAVVDLAMEPVMTARLHYWRWLDPGPLPGGAPIANFFGWWTVGTIAGAMLTASVPRIKSPAPAWVLGGFFVLILGLGLVA